MEVSSADVAVIIYMYLLLMSLRVCQDITAAEDITGTVLGTALSGTVVCGTIVSGDVWMGSDVV